MSDTELQNLDDAVGLGFCSYLDKTVPLVPYSWKRNFVLKFVEAHTVKRIKEILDFKVLKKKKKQVKKKTS